VTAPAVATRSAVALRATRRQEKADGKVKSPPKAEKKLILQSIVRHCEELNIKKGCDYGVMASIMKEKQPQYPWLERGMIYYMVKQLDTIVLLVQDKVKHLPRNRHNLLFAATLREMKEKKHDDHITLSSSTLEDQTTPLSSSNLGDQNSIQTTPSLNLGVRPTGTTIATVFDRKQRIRQANFFAAQRLERLRLLHHVKEKFAKWVLQSMLQ
jgi:hypothetical protein